KARPRRGLGEPDRNRSNGAASAAPFRLYVMTVRRLVLLTLLALLVPAAPAGAIGALVPAYTDSAANPVSQPIFVTAPPGDTSRLFIVERQGIIRVAVGGVVQDAAFLDIHTRVTETGEAGLLSMAFAPDYATSGLFYVYFVQHSDGAIPLQEL